MRNKKIYFNFSGAVKLVHENEAMEVDGISTALSVDKLITEAFSPDESNNYNNNNNNNDIKYQIKHHERFQSIPIRAEHEKFLRECIEIILNVAVFDDTQRGKKVLEWHQPEELIKLFNMKLKAQSDPDEKLLVLLKDTIRYSVKTGHPYFVNQVGKDCSLCMMGSICLLFIQFRIVAAVF